MRVYQFRHIRADAHCSPGLSCRPESENGQRSADVYTYDDAMRWGLAVVACAAAFVLAAVPASAGSRVEVIAELDAPSLTQAVTHAAACSPPARDAQRLDVHGPLSTGYLARRHGAAERRRAQDPRRRPRAPTIRWRYRITLNALAVVVPAGKAGQLRAVPGVARVTRSVAYGSSEASNLAAVKASLLWGSDFSTAGNGVKIAILDDGIDASHPYFSGAGLRDADRVSARPEGVHLAEGDRRPRVLRPRA